MFKEEFKNPITPETKVGDLLDQYPELEEVLIGITPVFNKLKNPVLRKTIAKVTSLKQAAKLGNIPLGDLINKLRHSAGFQNESVNQEKEKVECSAETINKPVRMIYDAREDLESGIPPIKKVMQDLLLLQEDELYKIITPFYPAPMIDRAKEKGYSSVTKQINDIYETYFCRQTDK